MHIFIHALIAVPNMGHYLTFFEGKLDNIFYVKVLNSAFLTTGYKALHTHTQFFCLLTISCNDC